MNALLSNPFKEGLRKGDTQIGLWLSSSTTSYMAGYRGDVSGYDWLLIDGESTRLIRCRTCIVSWQATPRYASQPVIFARSREVKRSVKQVLDIGAQTLPDPDGCDTATGVVVSATRYPPLGQRGVGASVAYACGALGKNRQPGRTGQ